MPGRAIVNRPSGQDVRRSLMEASKAAPTRVAARLATPVLRHQIRLQDHHDEQETAAND